MAEPRKPTNVPRPTPQPGKAPTGASPPARAPQARAPAGQPPPGKTPPSAPPPAAPLIEKPPIEEVARAPKPVQNEWSKPHYLIAYVVVGLLLVIFAFKWLFGSSGGSDLTRVRGTVTLEGKALVGAVVTFHPVSKAGGFAVGATGNRGQFSLTTAGLGTGVLPGEYRVTVTKFSSEEKVMNPDEAKKFISETGKVPPAPKVTNLLPAKYAIRETSGFSANVKSGTSPRFQFDLKVEPDTLPSTDRKGP